MDMGQELPEGWVVTKVAELADVVSPGFPYGRYNTDGQGFPHLRPMNIDSKGRLDLTDIKYVDVTDPPLLQKGDILFNNTNSPVWVGKTTVISQDNSFTFSNHMTRLRLHKDAGLPSFFALQLQYLQQCGYFLERCTHHVNQASIPSSYLANKVDLLVPPLPEQHRIVSVLEEQFTRLDAAIASLQQDKARLKQARASVLKAAVEGSLTEAWRATRPDVEPAQELLERILQERRAKWEADLRAKGKDPEKVKYVEPVEPNIEVLPELPEGWCWASMEQLITYLRNGMPQMPNTSPPGFRILRINAVRAMHVDLNEVRYLQLSEEEVKDYFISDGDILFTRYNGSLDLLGVAGLVRNCSIPTLHPDKLIRVKTVLLGTLASYIEIASNVGVSREYVKSRARTTAGQKGISGGDIRQVPIPIPSLIEQQQIVSEVEQRLSVIMHAETVVEASLKRAERARQSILQKAFSGQLVPQDSNDEPARVLLERIHEEREQRELEDQQSKKEKRMNRPHVTRKTNADEEQKPLVEVLREEQRPLSPVDLFKKAGLDQDDIEDIERFHVELFDQVQVHKNIRLIPSGQKEPKDLLEAVDQ